MGNLSDISYCFMNCPISGAIPTGFFDANTKLSLAAGAFQGTKISGLTNPQAYLFRYNTLLSSVNSMFYGCTSLNLQISDQLFVTNGALTDIQGFFRSCPNVTGPIPANLFNNIPAPTGTNQVVYLNNFFDGTGVSGPIPAGLLDKCKNLQQAQALFNNCAGITDVIPSAFFLNNTNLSQVASCFAGCTGITGAIPTDLLTGKTKLASANRLFYNCSNMDSAIPDDFLTDCAGLTDVSEMFSGCTKLRGAIPARDSYWVSTEAFNLASTVILTAETPDLTQLTVKLDAQSPILAKDVDYKVVIDGTTVLITFTNLTPTSALVHLPHSVPMAQGVATVQGTGVDQASLVCKDLYGTIFVLSTDYTVSTSGSNILVTRVNTGNIPSDMSTLYVTYDRTASVDRVALLNTYNIDLAIAPTVRPVIDTDSGDITTQNLNPTSGTATANSTVDLVGLSNANTCVVKIIGLHTGILTAQTSTDGVTWTNISTNGLLNLNTNLASTTIASGVNGVFQFSCAGKQAVRISANNAVTGTASITIYANAITATNGSDYTIAADAIGYSELTRNRNSTVIPSTQVTLVITYRHYAPSIDIHLDLVNRSTRPSLLGQLETVTKNGFLDKQVNLLNVFNLFSNCKNPQFNGSVPPKLFISGTKITNMNGTFGSCYYMTGGIPPALLHNCPAVLNLSNTFRDTLNMTDPTNTYIIPPGFFDKCTQVTTLNSFLGMGSTDATKPHAAIYAGVVDKNLFRYLTKLTDIGYLFWGVIKMTGPLDDDLFKYNTALTTATTAFWSTAITSIGPNLFRTCVNLTNMNSTFWSCTAVKGPVPAFWASDSPLKKVTDPQFCFRNMTASQIDNWNSIPATWK